MKKLFICLAFCILNIQAMRDPFMDSLSPENILGGAMRDVFHANDSNHELDSLLLVLEAYTAINGRAVTSSPAVGTTRSILSLNQAIMLGKLKAFTDRIEYEDFDSRSETRKIFTVSFKDLNSHIYAWAQQIEEKETNHTPTNAYAELKNKIQNDSTKLVTEDEMLTFQKPLFLAFLGYVDISTRRQYLINSLSNNSNLSRVQQNKKIEAIEHFALNITTNRAQYFAAIAAQNPNAINYHSAQPLHLEEPKTLIQQIQQLQA